MKKKIWVTAIATGMVGVFPLLVHAAEAEPVDSGTTAWMLTSTALVLLMVPGLAMFYGGLVRTKERTRHHDAQFCGHGADRRSVGGVRICTGVWKNILGGFAGWNSDYFFLKGIDDAMVKGVPEYVLAMFQGKFAIITPALISGALAERVYFRGYIAFIVLWLLFIYCPLCHWVWASDGWLFNAGCRRRHRSCRRTGDSRFGRFQRPGGRHFSGPAERVSPKPPCAQQLVMTHGGRGSFVGRLVRIQCGLYGSKRPGHGPGLDHDSGCRQPAAP